MKYKKQIHSLDEDCKHNRLDDIGRIHNLEGLYHYDAYCEDCKEQVYATKGYINAHKFIIVPWTVNKNVGWCSSEKQYNEIIVTKVKCKDPVDKQEIVDDKMAEIFNLITKLVKEELKK